MAWINVGDYRFNIMPDTAAWSYSMYVKSIDTYGGRVVQFLNSSIDALSVEGYIRPKKPKAEVVNGALSYPDADIAQWQGMREFEYNVRQIMSFHESEKSPVHFSFPEVGWDGMVFLTGYSDVRYEVGTAAVRYRLSFDIDSGFESILTSAESQGLDNIPNGVGWVRSIYNTPGNDGWSAAKKAIEKIVDDAGTFSASRPLDFYEYLSQVLADEDGKDSSKSETSSVAISVSRSAEEQFLSDTQEGKLVANPIITNFLEKYGLVSNWSV